MASTTDTANLWSETRQGLRERIKGHLDAADSSPDPADDMQLVDQLTRIVMMSLRELVDNIGLILSNAQADMFWKDHATYRSREPIVNFIEEWALSLSRSIDDWDKTLPFTDDELKKAREYDLEKRPLREKLVELQSRPKSTLPPEVVNVLFDIFPNLREKFDDPANHIGHGCSRDPENMPDIDFGDGRVGEFKTEKDFRQEREGKWTPQEPPVYDDVPGPKRNHTNYDGEPTIKGKLDRVTGRPATIYTPPEDLVDKADFHAKVMGDIDANSDSGIGNE